MALPATEAFTGAAGALTTGYQQIPMGTAGRTVNRDGSGHGVTNVSGVDTFAYDTANTYNNDQYSQEVVSSTAGGSPEPIVRASGTGTTGSAYFTYYTGSAIGIGKYVGGTFTDKGSSAASIAAADLIRIEVTGTGITVKKNGSTVATATDSSLTSGAAGPGLDNSVTILIDDWEGGNLGASSITGTASGSFALTGSAQGTVLVKGAASGSIAFTGPSQATVLIQGAASGLFSISGSATGVVGTGPISGVAGGVFDLSGTATATALVQGVATGTFALAGSAAATELVQGAASGTFALSGSAQGIVGALAEILGTAAGVFALSGAAQGRTMPDSGGGSSRKKRRGGLLFEQAALEKLEQMENSTERATTAPAREGVRKAPTPRVLEVSVTPMVTADDREEEELVLALFVERFF